MTRSTLGDLASAIADPAAPFVTHYDLATGERTEISGTTLANWVAKTANFLVDDAEAEPGTRVRIGLPSHWLRVVWLCAAWTVGATVTDGAADIGVSGPELEADEPVRVASALKPFGLRFDTPPAGFVDIGVEIGGHGDVFVALDPPSPRTIALDLSGERLTHAEMLASATPDGRRLLVTPGDLRRDAALLVNAALGHGSLVIVTGVTGPADTERIAAQERAVTG